MSITLCRILKTTSGNNPYGEYVDDALAGNKVPSLGKTPSSSSPSIIDDERMQEYMIKPTSAVYSHNLSLLKDKSSFFFYDEENDLMNLRKKCIDLLTQPAGIFATLEAEKGKAPNSMDLYGFDATCLLLLSVSDNMDADLIESGLARYRMAPYIQPDGTVTIHKEFEVSDKGFFRILDEALQVDKNCDLDNTCRVLAYGEFHDILNDPTIFDISEADFFDPGRKLGGKFSPQIRINNVQNSNKTQQESSYNDDEKAAVENWFKTLSPEDQKLFAEYDPNNSNSKEN